MRTKIRSESVCYDIRRYFTPSSISASQTPKERKSRAHGWQMPPLTYQALLDAQNRKVTLGGLNSQTAANRATALRIFMRTNGLNADDLVGNEMRVTHPDAVERMLKSLQDEGRSNRDISNTRSALKRWREDVIEYDTFVALDKKEGSPFVKALKSVMVDLSVNHVAKQVGLPKDMLRGWLIGKQPRASNIRYILRLEAFFGLERNSLVVLSGCVIPPGSMARLNSAATTSEYNKAVTELSKRPYCYKPGPDSPLRGQWEDFMKYKTAAVPRYLRTKRGKWRFSPCPSFPNTDANWWAFVDRKEVASAKMTWYKLSSYLGWLVLPVGDGGKAMPEEAIQTMAWLAVPDYIEEYFEWAKCRIGQLNQGTTQFLAIIASLVRPQYGYLRQRADLQSSLPESYRGTSWDDLCERQFRLTQLLVGAYQGEVEVSRDSFEPIRNIIALPQPMEAAIDLVQRMRASRPIGAPSLEAIWARDLAVVKLLLSNPLRLRNVAHLTWKADNTGELYQRPDKSWWIKIPKTKFKNRLGAAGESVYDVMVQPTAWPDIERYVFVFRPKLLRYPTDLVFLTRIEKGTTEHQPWLDLSSKIYYLTGKYLSNTTGFRAHAFRHLVATSILKSEGGSHKIAARVLNDRLSTVEKHYDGLTSNDGAEAMGRLLGPCFNRM